MNTVFTSALNVLGYNVTPLAPTDAVHQTTDGLGDGAATGLPLHSHPGQSVKAAFIAHSREAEPITTPPRSPIS